MLTTEAYHVLLLLLSAHLVGDFLLQTNRMVSGKAAGSRGAFLAHGAVHLALLGVVFVGAGSRWIVVAAAVAVVHVLIDLGKEGIARQLPDTETPGAASRRSLALFGIDQAVHIATLLVTAWIISRMGEWENMPRRFATFDPTIAASPIEPSDSPFNGWWVVLWTWAAGLVLSTRAGGMVIGMIVAPMLEEVRRTRPAEAAEDETFVRTDARGLQHGGRLIGWLERALIFLLVTNGAMAGVGFLAAAKSVFRFGELTDPRQRKEAEYILIGTLLSFTWGMFASWLTLMALQLLALQML